MMTVLADIPQHKQHVDRVRKLSRDDSLVVRNLNFHTKKYWRYHRGRG